MERRKLCVIGTRKDRYSTSEQCEVFCWDKLRTYLFFLLSNFQHTSKTGHARSEIEWNYYKRSFRQLKWSCEYHSCNDDLSKCKLGDGVDKTWIGPDHGLDHGSDHGPDHGSDHGSNHRSDHGSDQGKKLKIENWRFKIQNSKFCWANYARVTTVSRTWHSFILL